MLDCHFPRNRLEHGSRITPTSWVIPVGRRRWLFFPRSEADATRSDDCAVKRGGIYIAYYQIPDDFRQERPQLCPGSIRFLALGSTVDAFSMASHSIVTT